MPTMKSKISMHVVTMEVPSWRRPSWTPRKVFSMMLNSPRTKIQLSADFFFQMSIMAFTTTVTGHRWIPFHPTTGQSPLSVTTTKVIKTTGRELEEGQHLGIHSRPWRAIRPKLIWRECIHHFCICILYRHPCRRKISHRSQSPRYGWRELENNRNLLGWKKKHRKSNVRYPVRAIQRSIFSSQTSGSSTEGGNLRAKGDEWEGDWKDVVDPS